MIDPNNVTIYDRDDRDLQEFFIFSVCVAGKTAKVIAPAVARYIAKGNPRLNPLTNVFVQNEETVASLLKGCGIGCSSQKAKALKETAVKHIQCRDFLRICTIDDLEAINYVGPKTARFFLMHSRPGMRVAAIDTHILKHLASNGVEVPKTTPPKGPTYRRLEEEFLRLADASGMTPADYDLTVWKQYARS